MRNNKTQGFTLLELVVTMAIAAALITLAAPSIRRTIQDGHMKSDMSELSASLAFARNEAVRLNLRVIVCRSTDGVTCANAEDWAAGWIVITDANADGTFQNNFDELLRVMSPLSADFRLTKSDALAITYDASGGSAATTLTLCDARRDDEREYQLSISATGHVRSKRLNANDNDYVC